MIDQKIEKKFIFQVEGMHCRACELMIENELKEVPYIKNVKSNLADRSVEVMGYFGEMTEDEAASTLSKHIETHGYKLIPLNEIKNLIGGNKYSDFKIAVPIALAFVALFVALQKVGIINLAVS